MSKDQDAYGNELDDFYGDDGLDLSQTELHEHKCSVCDCVYACSKQECVDVEYKLLRRS